MNDVNWFSLLVMAALFAVFLLILLGVLISGWRTKKYIAENVGERKTRQILTAYFKSPGYHLLNNVTLPFEDGSTQVDHILVSTKGVFVIETKHYSGWLFASEKSNTWTQVLFRVKSQTPNPIRQNYRHVRAVRTLLDFIPKEHIHSLVVFTGTAVFKTKIPEGVVYLSELAANIKLFQEEVITQNRLQFIVGRLECTRYEITRQTDVEHKAYLNHKYGNK